MIMIDDHAPVLQALRDHLHATTRLGRADLMQQLAQAVYDHVKRHDPEGLGLDGRDGPERWGLATVCDAAIGHHDKMRATHMQQPPD